MQFYIARVREEYTPNKNDAILTGGKPYTVRDGDREERLSVYIGALDIRQKAEKNTSIIRGGKHIFNLFIGDLHPDKIIDEINQLELIGLEQTTMQIVTSNKFCKTTTERIGSLLGCD